MSWRNDPKIRDLEPYCKRHKYAFVVVYCVSEDYETFWVNTYGKNAKLCKVAKVAGDQLFEMAKTAKWPRWPEEEPAS